MCDFCMHALECLKVAGAGPPLSKNAEFCWGRVRFLNIFFLFLSLSHHFACKKTFFRHIYDKNKARCAGLVRFWGKFGLGPCEVISSGRFEIEEISRGGRPLPVLVILDSGSVFKMVSMKQSEVFSSRKNLKFRLSNRFFYIQNGLVKAI
jgi:hypothetical protein